MKKEAPHNGEKKWGETKEVLPAILAVVLVYGLFHITGIRCPIKFLTGISCAGCGMTRAYASLLKLDFEGAFYYHPLFAVVPVAVLIILFKRKIAARLYYFLIFTMIAAFLIIYVLRLLDASCEVVVFEPENGLIYRVLVFLGRSLKNVLQ